MTDSSQRLIARLVDDLEAVRPLPPIRQAFSLILALWAGLLGVVLWSKASELGTASLLEDPVYLASFIGLVVAAFGGTISALASGRPGRDRLELSGLLLSILGLLAAVIACWVGIRSLGPLAPPPPPGADAMCFETGAMLALLPAGMILVFVVRGWTAHPIRAAAIALLASGALGALIVHVTCNVLDPRHVLVGHLGVPIVLSLLGLYPLAIVLRRLRR
jgi:hypothetical protein